MKKHYLYTDEKVDVFIMNLKRGETYDALNYPEDIRMIVIPLGEEHDNINWCGERKPYTARIDEKVLYIVFNKGENK